MRTAALCTLSALWLAGCSGVVVDSTTLVPDAVAALRTYAWTTQKPRTPTEGTPEDDELLRARAQRALDDQLGAQGLVQRVPDPVDNRATRISITPAGRDTFETHWPTMARAYEHMFENISESERQVFVGTLKKILGNIRIHDF